MTPDPTGNVAPASNDTNNDETPTPTPPSASSSLPPPRHDIDFESLPWNLNCPTAHRYVLLDTTSGQWEPHHVEQLAESVHPYESTPLDLRPAATSLNYGTTVWEGLKCFRTSEGRAAIFRPYKNYLRFANGAEAMCLPPPSAELFLRGIQTAVAANADLIPPFAEGVKLYIRPILFGSGQQLGLYPSPRFSLVFYVSPTGNYFKGKASGGLKLHLETRYCRAARGGTGNVKCSGNYAVTLRPLQKAKAAGFDDNLYLELDTYSKGKLCDAVVQELSAANVFVVLKSGEIITPCLKRGTILPGVTRDSVLALARDESCAKELHATMVESTGDANVKVTVSERDVHVRDFEEATEAFVTGTAAEVVPIASLATGDGEEEFRVALPHGEALPGGPVTAKLLAILREVMAETRKVDCVSTSEWLPDPFASPEDFLRAASSGSEAENNKKRPHNGN